MSAGNNKTIMRGFRGPPNPKSAGRDCATGRSQDYRGTVARLCGLGPVPGPRRGTITGLPRDAAGLGARRCQKAQDYRKTIVGLCGSGKFAPLTQRFASMRALGGSKFPGGRVPGRAGATHPDRPTFNTIPPGFPPRRFPDQAGQAEAAEGPGLVL